MNSLFFHYCQKFEREITRKGYEKKVRHKLQEISQRQELVSGRDKISSFRELFVLKTGGDARTLIQRVVFEEQNRIIIYFVRDVIDHEDWVKTVAGQVKSGQWIENYPLSEDERNTGLTAYFKTLEVEKNINRSSPPHDMTAWFPEFKLKLGLEIYETESWVRYATNNTDGEGLREKDLSNFQDLLYCITSGDISKISHEPLNNEIQVAKNQRIGIVYTIIEELGKKYYLIYNGANHINQTDYWNRIKDEFTNNNTIKIPKNLEQLQQMALRAYPSYTLKPEQSELWEKIQKGSENSNYSLLKEQIDFLIKFQFPSYINGQAGSGKSTMLYYIFANVYLLKKLGAIQGDIIFLTENEQLLRNTKTAIKDLLLNNPEFGLNFETDFEDFDNYFASFKHFLLNLIPEDDQVSFPLEKYLDFSLFKKLYEDSNISQNIRKKYSAEESWFAITTYIKGYTDECIISSNNYETKVKQKSRILSRKKIEGIENSVWPFYKKLIEEKDYWDRLKIIKYIQESLSLSKKFEVVICDEAQDFCRVELRFILRLCELLRYDLSNGTEQVPILFAGDPNQTVNPTGFRLDEMKDILYEELKELAGFDILLKEELIYNPKHNYRSSQAVVNLANYIQYYRKKILGIQVQDPQMAKQSEGWQNHVYQNVFLQQNALTNNQNLVDRLQYKAFIIPSEQQEKEQYINKQTLFNEAIKEADIKTAIESKGAEYKQVVLYGFGEDYLEKFGELPLNKIPNDDDFEKRYFFNKLYVGITRAKDELIVIDSDEAKTEFWQKILSIEIAESNESAEDWQKIKSDKDLIIYDPESILESSSETALDNAKRDKEQGIINENPNQLKVAAKQFFRLNENNEQNECLAIAEKLLGNWKDAAQYYAKTKDGLEKSADCYWQGRLLPEMRTRLTNLKSPEHTIRTILAKLIIDDADTISSSDLNDLYRNKHLLRPLIENINWRSEIIYKLTKVAKSLEDKDQIRRLAELLLEIANSADIQLYESSGYLFQKINDYDWAIKAWNNIDNFEEKKVYIETKINQAWLRKNIDDEIIWRDKILTYQSQTEKSQTRQNLLQLYEFSQQNIEEDDALFAIYKAMLFEKLLESKLLSIARKVETKLIHEPTRLKNFYSDLLSQSEYIDTLIWNFILERWVKHSFTLYNSLEETNQQYKEWAEEQQKIFHPFSDIEIQNIDAIPQNINIVPTQHFQILSIQNFRRFEEISLQNLGQFNLIVGDNNTGKTSLLEALTFSPNEQVFATHLAFCYAERTNTFDFSSLKKDFWKDFAPKQNGEAKMTFIIQSGRNMWNYTFPNNNFDINFLQILDQKDSIKTPFIPYGKGFNKFVAKSYFDNIHSQGKLGRQNFILNLHVFIPTIETIIADGEEILIEEKDMYDRRGNPLFQYGEGANKLFRILVQMTLNKGGRIMIDEIDAGIHFSRFKKFWQILIQFAHQNDIQLFATTHNLECIQYFSEALEDLSKSDTSLKDSARTITLYETQEGAVKARTRTFEAFSEAIEEGYNIRGGE
jgi:AAA15 family ATPase/GTPase